jgi:hypothetical protein
MSGEAKKSSAQGLIDKGTREQEVKEGGSREERQEEAHESRAAGVRQQNIAHHEMRGWTEKRGASKMWKLYKEEELEKLKKRAKGSTLKQASYSSKSRACRILASRVRGGVETLTLHGPT